jgi:hypothetical protein
MRLLAQFVAVLLLVGFMGAYFWWIVAALTAVALVYFATGGGWPIVSASPSARLSTRIAARADQQHAWVH